MSGSGVFIERHEFIQAITPMSKECSGYVILGTKTNDSLVLIAVTIPFGHTLLVEPWAIHGDSTLRGMYSMAMTGNHYAMRTADTVFMKCKNDTKINVKITVSQPVFSPDSSSHGSKLLARAFEISDPEQNLISPLLYDDLLLTSN